MDFEPLFKTTENKPTAKFRDFKRFLFEVTKHLMPPEIRPKSFGTFEKRLLHSPPRGYSSINAFAETLPY